MSNESNVISGPILSAIEERLKYIKDLRKLVAREKLEKAYDLINRKKLFTGDFKILYEQFVTELFDNNENIDENFLYVLMNFIEGCDDRREITSDFGDYIDRLKDVMRIIKNLDMVKGKKVTKQFQFPDNIHELKICLFNSNEGDKKFRFMKRIKSSNVKDLILIKIKEFIDSVIESGGTRELYQSDGQRVIGKFEKGKNDSFFVIGASDGRNVKGNADYRIYIWTKPIEDGGQLKYYVRYLADGGSEHIKNQSILLGDIQDKDKDKIIDLSVAV
jgi:hypothetical protein